MTNIQMDRRTYLAGTAVVATGAAGLAGCLGESEATGSLATQVTDQPGDIADFESCVVTIVGMWLGPDDADDADDAEDGSTDDSVGDDADDGGNDADDEDSGGREYHEYDEPQEADLVDLQGENTQLVDERELDTGSYQFLQLDISGVDATLEDGSSAAVQVPGNAPLKFNESFEIRADTRTLFTADFTPVRRGQTGSYNLQPVASGTTVEYEELATDE